MHHTFSILLYLDCIQEKYTHLSCYRFWSNNRFDIPNRRVYTYRLYLYIVSCPLYTYISTWRMPEPFFFSLGNDIFCKVWEEPLKPDSVSTSSRLVSKFKITKSILILSFFLEKHLEGRSSYKSSFFFFFWLLIWENSHNKLLTKKKHSCRGLIFFFFFLVEKQDIQYYLNQVSLIGLKYMENKWWNILHLHNTIWKINWQSSQTLIIYSFILWFFYRDLWSLGFRIMLIWVQRIMPKRVSDQFVC